MVRKLSSREGICEGARSLVEDGLISREILPLIERALQGNESAYQTLLRAITHTKPRRDRHALFVETPAKAASNGAGRSDAETTFLSTRDEALHRAKNVEITPLPSPEDIESSIFYCMEYARSLNSYVWDTRTILEGVRTMLAGRLARRIVETLVIDGNAVIIPPAPSSRNFLTEIAGRLDVSAGRLESWTRWPMWNNVLGGIFAKTLAYGKAAGHSSVVSGREAAIEQRRAWFDDLRERGMTPADIVRCFDFVFAVDNFKANLKATAELGRFTPEPNETLQRDPDAAVLLAREMNLLHGIAPDMGSEKFRSLLTPYAPPMTADAIQAAISMKELPLKRFERFRARVILEWHAGDPTELAEFLATMVSRHKKSGTQLGRFCNMMLGVSTTALLRKIAALSAAGADTAPLLVAIAGKFPDSKREGFASMERIADAQIDSGLNVDGGASNDVSEDEAEQLVDGAQLMLPGLGLAGGVKTG
ncbi:MAG: hypothetical protein WC956_09775 [bacterium]